MASSSTTPSDDSDYKVVYEEEDDEQTIEEEEQFSVADGQRELNDLQADANMPLDELLKMYSNAVPSSANNESYDDEDDESTISSVNDDEEEEEERENNHHTHTLHHLFHSVNGQLLPDNGDDDDDDTEDSLFEPELAKSINIGDEYQAHVEVEIEFDPSNDDRDVPVDELLWSSSSASDLDEEPIDTYLKTIRSEYPSSDEEISLQTLLDCQLQTDLALVKFRQLPVKTIYSFSSWSLADTQLFEDSLREYGKNFSKIVMFKFPNRTVRELVHFYYEWKKSERFQLFLDEQQRLNSIKSSVSDMIEKFLEEQEHQLCSAAGVSDSTTSSSLLAPDLKRHSTAPISRVTSHQQETIAKRSFDQIDDDGGVTTKKSARFCETNTTTTSTNSSSTETIV